MLIYQILPSILLRMSNDLWWSMLVESMELELFAEREAPTLSADDPELGVWGLAPGVAGLGGGLDVNRL